jgi:hypothetical protein
VNDAARVPNFTLVAPLNFDPAIVTEAPVIPEIGVNEVTDGRSDFPLSA